MRVPDAMVSFGLRLGIERALRRESLSPAQLALALGEHPDLVKVALDEAERAGDARNVGSRDFPIFSWRLDRHAPATEAMALAVRLLGERPMNSSELAHALGVEADRARRLVMAIPTDCRILIGGRWFVTRTVRDRRG